MDIADMSLTRAQFEAQHEASMAVTKKAMDVAELQMQNLLQMLQEEAPVIEGASRDGLGLKIDVKA